MTYMTILKDICRCGTRAAPLGKSDVVIVNSVPISVYCQTYSKRRKRRGCTHNISSLCLGPHLLTPSPVAGMQT